MVTPPGLGSARGPSLPRPGAAGVSTGPRPVENRPCLAERSLPVADRHQGQAVGWGRLGGLLPIG